MQTIICPVCGNDDGITLCDRVPVKTPVLGIQDGKLILDTDTEAIVIWDAVESVNDGEGHLMFWCDVCVDDFTVEGMTLLTEQV